MINWWSLAGVIIVSVALAEHMQLSRIESWMLGAGIWLLVNSKALDDWERKGD